MTKRNGKLPPLKLELKLEVAYLTEPKPEDGEPNLTLPHLNRSYSHV